LIHDIEKKRIAPRCAICNREITNEERYVRCSVCGVLMHEDCIDREVLEDSEGNVLCPYDVLLAALDWFDIVVNTYYESLKICEEKLKDVIERLKSYIKLLEE
jgi:predicted RNA-binding Zn-ribbon protein involved in translation (DUF1610 family)